MIPIFVDMDGTLIKGSTSSLEIKRYIERYGAAHLAGKILRNSLNSRLKLKTWISNQKFDQITYKFDQEIVTLLLKFQTKGNDLILATASPVSSTNRVISQSPILFTEIISSNSNTNLKGSKKLAAIRKWLRTHEIQDFIYIGDSFVDLKIMKNAKESFFVGNKLTFFVGKFILQIKNIQRVNASQREKQV